MENVQKQKTPGIAWGRGSDDMHTGITIEQLIATVARVDAKVIEVQKMYAEIARTPAMPVRETASLVARPGAN